MVILDMTVVTVALPSIGRSLGFAPADLQWVVTAYLLATGGLTLLGGRAADLLGARRMFRAGLTLFTAASLASGLAPGAAALVASRAAQGAGAALLTPAALAVITATYSGIQRARALAVWGALASGGLALGVLAGGALTTWLGWRSVFLINVPVGLAVFAAGRHLPADRVPSGPGAGGGTAPGARLRRLDLRGAVLAVAGPVAGVYAISGAPEHGWASARTLGLLALSAALLASFGLAERRASAPLIAPGTLRSRTLVTGVITLFATTGILVGAQLLTSLFLQDVTGASPLRAGAEFLPLVVAAALGAGLASHLAQRAGTRVLATAGLALLASSALLLSRATADSGYLSGLLPGLLLAGLGAGLAFPAASITALSAVREGAEGMASGLLTTGHEVGAAVGAAVLAVAAAAAVPAVRPAPGTRVGFH